MCFGGGPDIPPPPKPSDPILPQQPIAPQNPASLQVGRKDEDADSQKLKANKARKKLRIKRDTSNVGTQVSGGGTAQKSSGTQTSG